MPFEASSPGAYVWGRVATASARNGNGFDMQLAYGAGMAADPEMITPIAPKSDSPVRIPVCGATILSLDSEGIASYRTAVFAPEGRTARDPLVEYAEHIDGLGQAQVRELGDLGRTSTVVNRMLGSRLMLKAWYATVHAGSECTVGGVLMTAPRTAEDGTDIRLLPFITNNVLKDSQKMEASQARAIGRGIALLSSAERNRRRAVKEGRAATLPDGMGTAFIRLVVTATNATPRGDGPVIVPITVTTRV